MSCEWTPYRASPCLRGGKSLFSKLWSESKIARCILTLHGMPLEWFSLRSSAADFSSSKYEPPDLKLMTVSMKVFASFHCWLTRSTPLNRDMVSSNLGGPDQIQFFWKRLISRAAD